MTGTKVLRAVKAAQEAQPLSPAPRGRLGKAQVHIPPRVETQPSAQAAPQQEEEGTEWDKEGEKEREGRKGEK